MGEDITTRNQLAESMNFLRIDNIDPIASFPPRGTTNTRCKVLCYLQTILVVFYFKKNG